MTWKWTQGGVAHNVVHIVIAQRDAQIDFEGFQSMVNTLGGVEVPTGVFAATEAFVRHWGEQDFAFAIINFANADMVGHTGVIEAAVTSARATARPRDGASSPRTRADR